MTRQLMNGSGSSNRRNATRQQRPAEPSRGCPNHEQRWWAARWAVSALGELSQGLRRQSRNGLGLALRRLGAWELRVERWGLPLGPYLESLRFATRLSRRLGPEILVGRRWGDPSGREPSGQPALWLED